MLKPVNVPVNLKPRTKWYPGMRTEPQQLRHAAAREELSNPSHFMLHDRCRLETLSSQLVWQQIKNSPVTTTNNNFFVVLSPCSLPPVKMNLFTGSGLGKSQRLMSCTTATELPLLKWR